jgi:uncharacterized membrane protein
VTLFRTDTHPRASLEQVLAEEASQTAACAARGPGILLGIGLGGFLDGIVLHQILQWHDTTVAGLATNTLWDGLFHAATWIAVAAGLYLLWQRTMKWRSAISGRALVGWMLVGWGSFNLFEGLVDHHILSIHHVREGPGVNETAWDLAFLAFGALLVIGGGILAGQRDS